jgi:hypothetical protein
VSADLTSREPPAPVTKPSSDIGFWRDLALCGSVGTDLKQPGEDNP